MKNEKLAKGEMNLNALFIGDKAENGQLYKEYLVGIDLVDEHLGWRQNHMPQRHYASYLFSRTHIRKATKKRCQPYEKMY